MWVKPYAKKLDLAKAVWAELLPLVEKHSDTLAQLHSSTNAVWMTERFLQTLAHHAAVFDGCFGGLQDDV